jgi:hypothetical protein
LTTVGYPLQSLPLISTLKTLTWHLIGPHEVPIRSEDRRALLESLDILEDVGSFGAELGEDDRVLSRSCSAIVELAEIAFAYRFTRAVKKASRALGKIRKTCLDYEPTFRAKRRRIAEQKHRLGLVDRYARRVQELNRH